ncbi:MAG: YfbK domain-containing protein [Acidimicrobiia bacterium]
MFLGNVSLRWHDVDKDNTSEISEPFTMDDVSGRFRDADGGFQLAVMVAEYAEILRGNGRAYFSDSTLDDLTDDIWWLKEYSSDPDVNEFIELVEHAARLRRG